MPDAPAPGPLVAAGRDARIYDIGGGRVLRRYARPVPMKEAAAMQHVAAHGFPVPEVYSVSGSDIVMERVAGPTMLEDLIRRPWRAVHHARLLAHLHRRLAEVPAPEWLAAAPGEGDRVVHHDLHPLNVVLSDRGPVVIDWANVARGPPGSDAAFTWLILATSVVPAPWYLRAVIKPVRKRFLRAFCARFDRRQLLNNLELAARARLTDPNVTTRERARIRRFLARVQ